MFQAAKGHEVNSAASVGLPCLPPALPHLQEPLPDSYCPPMWPQRPETCGVGREVEWMGGP